MKRINHLFIISALLALISMASAAAVSAQGGEELKPDITAPGVTNGWYTGNVTVKWPVPRGATVANGCEETTIDFDTPGVTLSCEVKTNEGTLSGSVVIRRDTTPPTIVTNPPEPEIVVDEGTTLILDAFESFDEISGVASITWDLMGMDGVVIVNGNLVNLTNLHDVIHLKNPVDFVAMDGPGQAEFSLQVTDQAGNVSEVAVVVIVLNVAPEISEVALSTETLPEGTRVTATTVFTDPAGVLDGHTATIDWGNGAVDSGVVVEESGSATFLGLPDLYNKPDEYTITITVTDDDGGIGQTSTIYSVGE